MGHFLEDICGLICLVDTSMYMHMLMFGNKKNGFIHKVSLELLLALA